MVRYWSPATEDSFRRIPPERRFQYKYCKVKPGRHTRNTMGKTKGKAHKTPAPNMAYAPSHDARSRDERQNEVGYGSPMRNPNSRQLRGSRPTLSISMASSAFTKATYLRQRPTSRTFSIGQISTMAARPYFCFPRNVAAPSVLITSYRDGRYGARTWNRTNVINQ